MGRRRVFLAALVLAFLFGASVAYVAHGTVGTFTYGEIAPPSVVDPSNVSWLIDEWPRTVKGVGPSGRELQPVDRRQIAAVYSRAWSEIELGIAARSPGVDPTFTGAALSAMKEWPTPVGTIGAASHRLQLRFYSDDGTTVSLRALTETVVVTITSDGTLSVTSQDAYLVVMQLSDDAVWRVRQLERRGATSAVTTFAASATGPNVRIIFGMFAVMSALAGFLWWRHHRRRRWL